MSITPSYAGQQLQTSYTNPWPIPVANIPDTVVEKPQKKLSRDYRPSRELLDDEDLIYEDPLDLAIYDCEDQTDALNDGLGILSLKQFRYAYETTLSRAEMYQKASFNDPADKEAMAEGVKLSLMRMQDLSESFMSAWHKFVTGKFVNTDKLLDETTLKEKNGQLDINDARKILDELVKNYHDLCSYYADLTNAFKSIEYKSRQFEMKTEKSIFPSLFYKGLNHEINEHIETLKNDIFKHYTQSSLILHKTSNKFEKFVASQSANMENFQTKFLHLIEKKIDRRNEIYAFALDLFRQDRIAIEIEKATEAHNLKTEIAWKKIIGMFFLILITGQFIACLVLIRPNKLTTQRVSKCANTNPKTQREASFIGTILSDKLSTLQSASNIKFLRMTERYPNTRPTLEQYRNPANAPQSHKHIFTIMENYQCKFVNSTN